MHYQILSKLSEGGFSEVFEVRDSASALDEVLVLKRLNSEMSRRPDVRRAFTHEGQILANLRHPNVVTFRRCYFEGDHICLVMERVAGEPLHEWLQAHRPEPDTVLDAFRQILEAVDHLHHRSKPLLHLDLKPENILMQADPETVTPRPVLIDFGIARDLGAGGLQAYTPPYAAPEQVRGERLGCFTDVFALGQILAETLAVLTQVSAPDARTNLEAVSDRARDPSRRRRYADAGEMLRGFRQARHQDRTGTGVAALSEWRRRLPVGPSWLPWALGGLALAAALVAAVPVLSPSPPAERAQASGASAPHASTTPASTSDRCWFAPPDAADAEAILLQFERCSRIALGSTSRRQIRAQYQAASEFVAARESELDPASRDHLQQRFQAFRKQIDRKVRASR